MESDYLTFYKAQNISPCHPDISDLERHYERRRKLYRQCGIPEMTFKNSTMLEVGPGSGYNTLAFFHMTKEHIDLVEANPVGIHEMGELFEKHKISSNRYTIYETVIEQFEATKTYDIIIAEGFLQVSFHQKEIIKKLKSLVNPKGIIVITCEDDVSIFVEAMKRLIGVLITENIQTLQQKKEYLVKIFSPILKSIKGMTRPVDEWVDDQLINTGVINGVELCLDDAIDYMEDEFYVLGTSPHMFTDYSFYKNIEHDVHEDYKAQFVRKHLSLMLAETDEMVLDKTIAERLSCQCRMARRLAAVYEKEKRIEDLDKIMNVLQEMKNTWKDIDLGIFRLIEEIYNAIKEAAEKRMIDLKNYQKFASAWGRVQQYVAFEKKW